LSPSPPETSSDSSPILSSLTAPPSPALPKAPQLLRQLPIARDPRELRSSKKDSESRLTPLSPESGMISYFVFSALLSVTLSNDRLGIQNLAPPLTFHFSCCLPHPLFTFRIP